MRPTLSVAVAQLVVAATVEANVAHHAAVVRAADARVVVFPELSLTGYELAADPVEVDDARFWPLVSACAEAGAMALVGAPVMADGARCIATLRVDAHGVSVVYRKLRPGREELAACFEPGPASAVVEVDGWRLGLGICKDVKTPEQVAATLALGVDAYLAGVVHVPDELDLQDALGAAIARDGDVYVAFASCAGATGGEYDQTAGHSAIWGSGGARLAIAGGGPGDLARAVLT